MNSKGTQNIMNLSHTFLLKSPHTKMHLTKSKDHLRKHGIVTSGFFQVFYKLYSFFFKKWGTPGPQEEVTFKNPLKTGTSYKMENRKNTKEDIPEEGAGPSYIRSGDCFVLVLGYQNKVFL